MSQYVRPIFRDSGSCTSRLRRPESGGSIREQLCEELRNFDMALRQTDRQAGLYVNIFLEIDFAALGLEPVDS